MDLRRFAIILISFITAAHAVAADIRSYPLDDRSVYTVRLSREEPTTCVFPGALKAFVGANVSTKAEDNPGVLLSHEPGTEYFSLRALKENATGALNILFRGQVFVLALTTGSEADRSVMFLDEPLAGTSRRAPSQDVLRTLIQRAKQQDRLTTPDTGMKASIDRAQPGNATRHRDFTALIESVTRFEAEDALVFCVRLENTLDVAVPYDPQGLAIRLGREIFPAAFAEATGAIPLKAATAIYLVITGSPAGGRANLSVREMFSVIVPRP